MDCRLNGKTFRCSDGHTYSKAKSDMCKTKLYYQCYKHRKGCRVMIHTNYTDKDEDRLHVIYRNESHNHPPREATSNCASSRSNPANAKNTIH